MGASVQTSSLLEHFLCAHYVARHCARHFVVVQSLCRVQLFAAPWTTARQDSLSSTIFQSLLKFIFIESMMSSNHIILCCPLLLSVFPSIRVFSNESALRTRWPKYWSFSFSIGASKEYSGLTSFRTDWFDLLPEVLSASPWGVHMSRGWGSEWRQAEMGSSHAQKNLSRETYSRNVPGMCTHWRRGTRTVS